MIVARRQFFFAGHIINKNLLVVSRNIFHFILYSLLFRTDVTDTPSRKKRTSSHREEGETTETYVAQMTVFDKNR